VKWTSGLTSLVTAAAFVTLVAGGVAYVINGDPREASLAQAPRRTTGVPTATPAPSTITVTSTPTVEPATPAPLVTLTARPSVTASKKPTPAAPSPTATPEPPPTLDLVVSSFNVLGSSHTTGDGNKSQMASGTVRARRAAEIIRRHGADVVGFQELQRNQLRAVQRHTNFDFFPGTRLRGRDSENSIGWRRDRFVAVEAHTIGIPYFNGNRREMPYVRLRSLTTGVEAWFANFHNPADTGRFPRQQRFRDRATALEIALVNRLVRETDLPVFVTGDMNERDEYFCRITARAPMIAARGGSNVGRCRPQNPRAVDWIFGSQDVTFTGYFEDRSGQVRRATDHPVLVASARIVGEASGPDDDSPAD
jgi:hypothetical protein